MSDDDLHIQLMLSEPCIAKLTEPAVAAALEGFPLTPVTGMAWLARAIQGALYVSLHNASDGPERQSNAETKAELHRLATHASRLWLEIQERSAAGETALWDYAWDNWHGEGSFDADPDNDDRRFHSALAQLDWLSQFMRRAAESLPDQPKGPWRQSERRQQRILRAHCLSPIYETAFATEATVNTWPGANGGPWPDFYQRIVALAFDERSVPDLEGVLDEARRRHKAAKVEFAAGIIPDFPL